MRASVDKRLAESGERERLKELLRARLVECGWRDDLKAHCKTIIKSKGLEAITVQDLVSEITPKGRATIPEKVKAELLESIRAFLADEQQRAGPVGEQAPPAAAAAAAAAEGEGEA